MINEFKKLLNALASPRIFFFALIWLMVLLVAGTVSQKYIGLYLAQKTYFSSFVLWPGGLIPLPGGYTTLGVIGINIAARTATESWSLNKAGTAIIHFGALLLLLGGLITAVFSQEGNMVIPEGQAVSFMSDYHSRELALFEISEDNIKEVIAFGEDVLKTGKTLTYGITVNNFYRNSQIQITDNGPRIIAAPRALEDEENVSALLFSNGEKDYTIFEFMPRPPVISYEGKNYMLLLRRARTELPFEIELLKFTKEVHPGTETARFYSSEVILRDGEQEWHSVISMNKPLRYKGYTFFQSSFLQGQEFGTSTVLAVVKNAGRLYPYIASIIICIGLLVHMIIMIPKLTARKEKK